MVTDHVTFHLPPVVLFWFLVFFFKIFFFFIVVDKRSWFSGEPTKPERYGYCKGSEAEARAAKLKQTLNRVVSVVAEGPSSFGAVSKGLKNEFKLATEAAKGNAGKTEFLEKHVHKQQHEIEELTKLVKGGNVGASSSSQVCLLFQPSVLFFSTPYIFFVTVGCPRMGH